MLGAERVWEAHLRFFPFQNMLAILVCAYPYLQSPGSVAGRRTDWASQKGPEASLQRIARMAGNPREAAATNLFLAKACQLDSPMGLHPHSVLPVPKDCHITSLRSSCHVAGALGLVIERVAVGHLSTGMHLPVSSIMGIVPALVPSSSLLDARITPVRVGGSPWGP